jgi:hypothetical protein
MVVHVGKGLPPDAALYPRRAQISSASWRKPEIMDFCMYVFHLIQFVQNFHAEVFQDIPRVNF